MADIIPTPSTKTKKGRVMLFVIGLILLLVVLWYFFYPRLDMKQVKQEISDFAKDSSDPVHLELLLLQGVHEIRWQRSSYLQCKKVAQEGNIPIETVIVNAAIEQARLQGFIG